MRQHIHNTLEVPNKIKQNEKINGYPYIVLRKKLLYTVLHIIILNLISAKNDVVQLIMVILSKHMCCMQYAVVFIIPETDWKSNEAQKQNGIKTRGNQV